MSILEYFFEFSDDSTMYVSTERYICDMCKECSAIGTASEPATGALFTTNFFLCTEQKGKR